MLFNMDGSIVEDNKRGCLISVYVFYQLFVSNMSKAYIPQECEPILAGA